MADERWVVQVESPFLYGAWNHIGPVYVSEEVANLALKHHWQPTFPRHTFRVARVR